MCRNEDLATNLVSRVLWINPAAGASGDMMLGALLDVGAELDLVVAGLDGLGLSNWTLEVGEVFRQGLRCARAEVRFSQTGPHRSWTSIDELLQGAGLSDWIARGARRTFRLLGEVEAARHGVPIDEVEFHELGAIDAIIDIVGSWIALSHLSVESVYASPVGIGSGLVKSNHGTHHHPAPATLVLLQGCDVAGIDADFETITPTGAALLKTMVSHWGPIPAGRMVASGFGAGSRDSPDRANLISVSLLTTPESRSDSAVLLQTVVDDVSPEVLGHLLDLAIKSGADDAWLEPIIMKKSRPGVHISVLCRLSHESVLADLIARETGTLGIRSTMVFKREFERRYEIVSVAGLDIRIKIGPRGAKPEFSDVVDVANELGRPVRSVAFDALREWARRAGDLVDQPSPINE